jgi:hypothetical protein
VVPSTEAIAHVRDQALEVARGWAGEGAPGTWRLTAALFEAVAHDHHLAALAAGIPPDRLPALLFVASVQYLVVRHPDDPLAAYYPAGGEGGRPVDDHLVERLRAFCTDHRDELVATWSSHRYQMNEVARCTQVALALGVLQRRAPGRELALLDVGTGCGLGLFPDRYAYSLVHPAGGATAFGSPTSDVRIACQVDGGLRPGPPGDLPIVVRRGLDADPIAVEDPEARAWLAACSPPATDAQARLQAGVEVVRAGRPSIVRGDVLEALPALLDDLPAELLVAVVDTYTAVFLDHDGQTQLAAMLRERGAARDLAWISLDPLVPLGTEARSCVQGVPVPAELVTRNREGGVFALLSMVSHLGGQADSDLLATAHPSGTRMTWLDPATAVSD